MNMIAQQKRKPITKNNNNNNNNITRNNNIHQLEAAKICGISKTFSRKKSKSSIDKFQATPNVVPSICNKLISNLKHLDEPVDSKSSIRHYQLQKNKSKSVIEGTKRETSDDSVWIYGMINNIEQLLSTSNPNSIPEQLNTNSADSTASSLSNTPSATSPVSSPQSITNSSHSSSSSTSAQSQNVNGATRNPPLSRQIKFHEYKGPPSARRHQTQTSNNRGCSPSHKSNLDTKVARTQEQNQKHETNMRVSQIDSRNELECATQLIYQSSQPHNYTQQIQLVPQQYAPGFSSSQTVLLHVGPMRPPTDVNGHLGIQLACQPQGSGHLMIQNGGQHNLNCNLSQFVPVITNQMTSFQIQAPRHNIIRARQVDPSSDSNQLTQEPTSPQAPFRQHPDCFQSMLLSSPQNSRLTPNPVRVQIVDRSFNHQNHALPFENHKAKKISGQMLASATQPSQDSSGFSEDTSICGTRTLNLPHIESQESIHFDTNYKENSVHNDINNHNFTEVTNNSLGSISSAEFADMVSEDEIEPTIGFSNGLDELLFSEFIDSQDIPVNVDESDWIKKFLPPCSMS